MRRRSPPLRLVLLLLLAAAATSTSAPSAQQTQQAERTQPTRQAQQTQPPAGPPPAGAPALQPVLDTGGEVYDLGPPARATSVGPLFPLRRIAARLGGELSGEDGSVTLTLGEIRVIAGPENPVAIVGREIVELSQPPQADELEGLLVPLDLLSASYGELLEFSFEWPTPDGRLAARRRQAATLPVTVDVVHLQGVTTVVLRFPERFDYELVERRDAVEVRPERDRFQPPFPAPRVADPLVEEVRVAEDRVRIELAPDASAESYVLEQPFRLVFDVVRMERRAETEAGEEPEVEPPEPSPGIRTIVIDPGHGGGESGAVGPAGEAEKDLTLEIARTLRARLLDRFPVRVVLTRDEDASLPLDTRSAIANQNKADLFVSIHLNSSLGSRARGAETYFLSMEASDARAAELAAAENQGGAAAAGADDPLYDLQLILWDLAQSYHLAASQRVAALIQEELNTTLGLRDRGVKQAPFRVLMGAAMPAVLVELGFLSNPQEEERLQDPVYRGELVEALVRAIGRYRAEVDERAAAEADEAGEDRERPAEPTP